MKFGHFDDKKQEYVISTPYTPLPWINYIGQNDMYGLISNTCGGYTFYKDAKLRRLTRFRYNNVPRDFGGRYYYINDDGKIWNPGFMPTRTTLDSYKCRHGLGYSIFESECSKLSVCLTCFVPLNVNAEIHKLVLTNNSATPKFVKVYGTAEFCLYNAVDDSTNFQRNYNTGEVTVGENSIYHITEYRERRNHYAFYHVNRDISGFDSDLDTFIGNHNSWADPEAVEAGTSFSSLASGWSPIGCLRNDICIKPGESVCLIYILGYVENDIDKKFLPDKTINKEKALKIMDDFSTEDKVDNAFNDLHNYWNQLLSRFTIKSDDPKFDRMVNIWNQYQCMTTFNMSRSASYFESGIGRGMGFRDSCQDILGFVHLIPDKSRTRILDIASIQFKDGSTYHQYQPLSKKGNADIGSGFNDDPLWLVACTYAYVCETGDLSILKEKIPFDSKPGTEAPLFEHLKCSIHYTITHKGPHNLPLIGRADWNDCLNLNCFSNTPGESFQTCSNFDSGKAESVFIAGMFVKYGKEYAELSDLLGEKEEASFVLDEVKKMEDAVIMSGWDGNWFLRAYDAYSKKIGSKECTEGKIFIEPQGFCTMAGIGKDLGYGKKAMASVTKYLLSDYGVQLLYPCYTSYHIELGEISSYPPGYKENGSVFCHCNPWIIIAETEVGNNEEAFDLYKRFAPSYTEDISQIHRSEPYIYCQTIAGREAQNYGEGKNSWLTGTASWSFVAVSQAILGIKPSFDGLVIDPHLPSSIKKAKVTRIFRNIKYEIDIINSGSGKYVLSVDGVVQEGKKIRYDETKKLYSVRVEL